MCSHTFCLALICFFLRNEFMLALQPWPIWIHLGSLSSTTHLGSFQVPQERNQPHEVCKCRVKVGQRFLPTCAQTHDVIIHMYLHTSIFIARRDVAQLSGFISKFTIFHYSVTKKDQESVSSKITRIYYDVERRSEQLATFRIPTISMRPCWYRSW